MPVLVRAGAIIPTQPEAPYTPAVPPPKLVLTAFAGTAGALTLYDDEGAGFGYARGAYTRTPISQRRRRGRLTLTIASARGRFPGARATRDWEVRVLGVRRPATVRVNGRRAAWSYDSASRMLTVDTGARATNRAVTLTATRT
jgi:hypothetical protein